MTDRTGGPAPSCRLHVGRWTSPFAGALSVAVFPSTTDSAFGDPQSLAGRPGSWRLAGPNPGADFYLPPSLTTDGLVFARDPNRPGGGKPLTLDRVTLK
jgi:hypothetical protein